MPPEFSQHRYLTRNASSRFLDPDYGPLGATRYATRTFKRLLYHTCEHPADFLPRVTGEIERFEQRLLERRDSLEAEARALLASGRGEDAEALLTRDVHQNLLASLTLGEELVRAVEGQTRRDSGIRMPRGERREGETTPATSQPMARHGWGAMIHCLESELADYPRPHGRYQGAEPLVEAQRHLR